MKIVWSPLAVERIEEYAERIAWDNPAAATQWVEEIFGKVDSLAEFPEMGRLVPELRRVDIRELIFGQFRIIYRVGDSIYILTVRHSRQLLSDSDIEEDA
ncbi:type II toxin-antitoxin system RelE/ParE family toxin [Arhodomonas sp. SL1]|uniref:type II toxin-antitoxin system RelE/ParE family toxin n=1 Tax=Arhodomonas sp. SL1 TaxID=3425691 RepID=UPI003F884606